MKHWMRKCILLLAFLVLLSAAAAAYEVPTDFTDITLEQAVEEFMQAYGLGTNNFSVSFCNTVTGERYAFNDKNFMVAASTYKLPLNMYYYEQEHAGTMASDVYISRVGGTLEQAHEQSLVYSNNEMSIGMLYNLGEFRDYKELMRKYFTMPEEEIEPIYYRDNYYCTHMMMDALLYLYEYRADFEEMIDYMKQAQPGEYFKAGVTEYEVAHKYGWFEGALNDVGIIYTPQPILLAVYTQYVSMEVLEKAAALFTAYAVWQQPEEEPPATHLELEVQYVPVDTPEEEPAESVFEEVEEVPLPEQEPVPSAFEWWMVAVAVGVFLAGGGSVLLILQKKNKMADKT
ncbi:MAG: serine hydrolase [Oscillospiraceae bacterium]|nr:serine hydrolase [Oscillospiraceae bacterium]